MRDQVAWMFGFYLPMCLFLEFGFLECNNLFFREDSAVLRYLGLKGLEPIGARTMTERLTINRPFHVAIKRSGTKQIQSGAIVITPAGRVPRISRLLALAHHCFRLVQSGAIINQSELAHFGQV